MKFPGTAAAYAIVMSIFGQTINGIHLGLIWLNATTMALIFLLGRFWPGYAGVKGRIARTRRRYTTVEAIDESSN